MSRIEVVAASAEHAAALQSLFDDTSHGCHCRFWHFSGDDNAWQARMVGDQDDDRHELALALAAGSPEAQGLVALDSGRALGWLKLCAEQHMQKLYTRRPYRMLPRRAATAGAPSEVLFVGCALVRREARRRGIFGSLVHGAISEARRRGARVIEAFPRRSREPMRDDELWTGVASTLEAAGFRPSAGEDPYPVLRLEL